MGGRSTFSSTRDGLIRDNAANSILQPPALGKRAHVPPPARNVLSQPTVSATLPPHHKYRKSNPTNNIAACAARKFCR